MYFVEGVRFMSNIHLKSQLDTRELLLLDSELKTYGKSMLVGYLLWYFLGIFGGHRFYLKRTGTAVAMLVLSITIIGLIVTSIWWIVDAFLTYQMVKEENERVESSILAHFISQKQANNQYQF
jgi:hypothetical protein